MSEVQNARHRKCSARRATVREVAARAGVSVATVSRALKSERSVALETSQRVWAVAEELGYQANVFARNLSRNSSDIIAVVVGDITNPFYPEVIDKLAKRLSMQKLSVMLVNVIEGARAEESLAPLFQYQVKAAIFVALPFTSDACEVCRRHDVPIILFNRYVDDSRVLKIVCDNINAGRVIAQALCGAGHRKMVYVAGRTDTSTNRDRQAGFTEVLRESGVCECVIECAGSYSYEAGHQAGLRLVRENRAMDAIFCANDIIAMGMMDALRYGGGLRVPEDVSVVGFDDIAGARWPVYDLTTVRQPVDRMIEMVSAKLESYTRSGRLIEDDHNLMLAPGRLIARSSAKLSRMQCLSIDPNGLRGAG